MVLKYFPRLWGTGISDAIFCTLQNSVWDLHGPLNFNVSFGINIITSGFIAFCFA